MSRTSTTACAAALLAGSTLFTLTACQSAEKQREEARDSAATLRSSLKSAPAQIDSTMNALFQATSGDNTNRAVKYDTFRRQFSSLQSDAATVRDHALRARADAAKYFRTWANEAAAADPAKRTSMKDAAEGRVANYDTALSYLDGGRDAYTKLLTDLTDIQRQLDKNLTLANSGEIEKLVNTAKIHSVDLKEYISVLSDRIDKTLATK